MNPFATKIMKHTTHSLPRLAAWLLLGTILLAPSLRAQSARQIINLVDGWNAVWLEVEPTGLDGKPKAPGDVFPAQVLTVITPKALAGTAEFFAADPVNAGTFNQEGWKQWHNPSNPADNLDFITGNRPYLIEVAGDQNFVLEGKVRFHRPAWVADRYNLVGFGLGRTPATIEGGVDGTPPTFDQFFGDSNGKHPVNRIFRLNPATGNWQGVAGTDPMVSDQAYWVFSSGTSNYMGPVAVDFNGAVTGSLNFGGPADAVAVGAEQFDLDEVVFTNLDDGPVSPSLDLITNRDPGASNPDDLELYAVLPVTDGTLGYQQLGRIDSSADGGGSSNLMETIAPNTSQALTIGAKRLPAFPGGTNLYRLRTGAGSEFWLPVAALNSDLEVPNNPTQSDAGLWVGEVSVKGVASFAEDGQPVRPAVGPAPLRLLLHFDGSNVSLLSQVTIMQTRTADPEVAPAPVLVIDPAKIPFFEGIKERNGKRVGLRLEAVAFDMPRKLDPVSQDALIADPNFLVLTTLSPDLQAALSADPLVRTQTQQDLIDANTAAIDAAKLTIPTLLPGYLLSSKLRPSKLAEKYDLSWPLEGVLGAGQTVSTIAGQPLVLDPFHRSNPFRHAFHQKHAKGQNITRTLQLDFDSEQPVADRLRGTYTERIIGLTKPGAALVLTGIIQLSRVSGVATLDGAQ